MRKEICRLGNIPAGPSDVPEDDPSYYPRRNNYIFLSFNELIGIVPLRDCTSFKPAHLHVLTSSIWDVRNQVYHQGLKETYIAETVLRVFIESWLYLRKSSGNGSETQKRKRKRGSREEVDNTSCNALHEYGVRVPEEGLCLLRTAQSWLLLMGRA